MIFTETKLRGAFVIEPQLIEDARGFFARTWAPEDFEARGLNPRIAQCSISYNARRGTLRGMHYQAAPYAEVKVVRCTRGTIYDVAVDIREGSPTYLRWAAVELSERNRAMLYIPEGFAHGYQTLEDDTEVFYQVSEGYRPQAARGLRWDDPALGIAWPLPLAAISDRDREAPLVGARRNPPHGEGGADGPG
jgi:dTDP-4-dehydrorhamnose 3,5-epimerase